MAVVFHRLLILLRSILLGWATLLSLVFLAARPLLTWTGPFLGATWFQTARLALDCLVLAVAGWVVGRTNRSSAMRDVWIFAVTLTFWNFGQVLSLNVPWLIRLAINTLGDVRYLDSFLAIAGSHLFLFGILIAGGLLSRSSRIAHISVFGNEQNRPRTPDAAQPQSPAL